MDCQEPKRRSRSRFSIRHVKTKQNQTDSYRAPKSSQNGPCASPVHLVFPEHQQGPSAHPRAGVTSRRGSFSCICEALSFTVLHQRCTEGRGGRRVVGPAALTLTPWTCHSILWAQFPLLHAKGWADPRNHRQRHGFEHN